jgi:hypothetical protein
MAFGSFLRAIVPRWSSFDKWQTYIKEGDVEYTITAAQLV